LERIVVPYKTVDVDYQELSAFSIVVEGRERQAMPGNGFSFVGFAVFLRKASLGI
jgi:hypothetical protein